MIKTYALSDRASIEDVVANVGATGSRGSNT
jgi:hypothetical protein